MKCGARRRLVVARVLLLAGGLGLLLLAVARGDAAPGSGTTSITVPGVLQGAVTAGLLASSDSSGSVSAVDIPPKPVPRTPVRPPKPPEEPPHGIPPWHPFK